MDGVLDREVINSPALRLCWWEPVKTAGEPHIISLFLQILSVTVVFPLGNQIMPVRMQNLMLKD